MIFYILMTLWRIVNDESYSFSNQWRNRNVLNVFLSLSSDRVNDLVNYWTTLNIGLTLEWKFSIRHSFTLIIHWHRILYKEVLLWQKGVLQVVCNQKGFSYTFDLNTKAYEIEKPRLKIFWRKRNIYNHR